MIAQSRLVPSEDSIAIYHAVHEDEGFNHAAQALFQLTQQAENEFPGKRRVLFLDIDGHRNSDGGFDHDMMDLQGPFLLGFLSKYLSKMTTPFGEMENTPPQQNDIPEQLMIGNEEDMN